MGRKILITGAGSGLGEGTAIGLARNGHDVIATAQTWPQVTALRLKSKEFALATFRVEKLDLLDPYDVARACKWDFDILVNNAGIGEGGPIAEIPLDLVRTQFRGQRLCAARLTQTCREKLGCGQDPREKSFSYRQWAASSAPRGSPLMPRRSMRLRRWPKRCRRN